MKFLKNLFQKSKGEDDEDLEDNEDFDFEADSDDEDDRLGAQVITDHEDDLDAGSPSDDDEQSGTDNELSVNDHDGPNPAIMGVGESNVGVGDSEEADDDDLDLKSLDEVIDFDNGANEESDDGGGSKKFLFAATGIGVLVLGIFGGSAFWYFSSDATESAVTKAAELDGGVQMALPSRSGLSLNSIGIGGDDQPDETSETREPEGEADTADASDEQPKDGLAQPSETEKQIMSPATLGSSGLNDVQIIFICLIIMKIKIFK